MKIFFQPNNNNSINTRYKEKYKVTKTNTERLKKSSIIQMQKIANQKENVNW